MKKTPLVCLAHHLDILNFQTKLLSDKPSFQHFLSRNSSPQKCHLLSSFTYFISFQTCMHLYFFCMKKWKSMRIVVWNSSKCLCVPPKKQSYGFGTAWEWLKDYRMFIFTIWISVHFNSTFLNSICNWIEILFYLRNWMVHTLPLGSLMRSSFLLC